MNRALVVALVVWCWCSHARHCPAPPGWYVNGARPSGEYELRPVLGRPQDDLLDAWLRRELSGPSPVAGRVYCTGGATLHQDGLSVWCQR